MAGSFLQRSRHGTVFYFRRRVPDDLRATLGHSYIVKSLSTEERRVAIIRARFLASQTDALFAKCRTMPNTDDDSKTLFTLSISVDEIFGRRTAVATDVKPGEGLEAALATMALQDQLDGKPLSPHLQAMVEVQTKAPAPAMSAPPPERPVGMPFKDALAYYLANPAIKVTSRNTYENRLKHAQAFFGEDKDVRHIERDDLQEYSKHVTATVQNVTTQGHTIRQLIAMLNHLREDYKWGERLSTKRLIQKKEEPDSDDRDSFTLEQLAVLFENAKQYKEHEPAKYWATVALPFLGCRIAELLQINLATDLQQDSESKIWFVDFNARRDPDGVLRKSLKNKVSWRKIPIHSALVKHGFVDYLHQQATDGFTRPFEKDWGFYLLKPTGGGGATSAGTNELYQWGRRASNWASLTMSALRESGAIDDPDRKLVYFHSMRHTFSCALASAGIGIDMAEAAMGHKYGSKDAERYAKIKKSPVLMSEQVYEPGLAKIAALLDNL